MVASNDMKIFLCPAFQNDFLRNMFQKFKKIVKPSIINDVKLWKHIKHTQFFKTIFPNPRHSRHNIHICYKLVLILINTKYYSLPILSV